MTSIKTRVLFTDPDTKLTVCIGTISYDGSRMTFTEGKLKIISQMFSKRSLQQIDSLIKKLETMLESGQRLESPDPTVTFTDT